MKKAIIIILLFALPIVAYLFFASGVHNFAKLPIIDEEIGSLNNFKSLNNERLAFSDHISILGFYGKDVDGVKGYALNLNQKIYDRYYKFKDFQVIIAMPNGTQEDVKVLLSQLDDISDTVKWRFVFGEPQDINNLFNSLNTKTKLHNLGTPYLFIIDKEAKLRGRDDENDDLVPFGYDASSVAELSDKMNDDVKVILAEYRLELKKYNKENK